MRSSYVRDDHHLSIGEDFPQEVSDGDDSVGDAPASVMHGDVTILAIV